MTVIRTRLVVRFTMVDNSTERESRRTLIEVEPKYTGTGGAYLVSLGWEREEWLKSWAERHAPRIADGLVSEEKCRVEWSIIEYCTTVPETTEREVTFNAD